MAHVILNGLKKELKFTVFALAELGRELGRDIDEPGFLDVLGFHKVCYLLWAGLLHETQDRPREKRATVEQITRMLPSAAFSSEFVEIRNAVIEAFLESQGWSKELEPEKKNQETKDSKNAKA